MTRLSSVLFALCIALISGSSALAQSSSADARTIALKGFDPVAYFTESRPVKGSSELAHDWDDSRYLFSSTQHRDKFAAAPEQYAPQFGSLCATGLSAGKRITADPEIWKIVDGKLYIFSSAKARDMAVKDPARLDRARQAHAAPK